MTPEAIRTAYGSWQPDGKRGDVPDHVAVDAGVSHRALDGARAAHKAPQTYPSSDITDATNTTITKPEAR